jgi:hypothetical protein
MKLFAAAKALEKLTTALTAAGLDPAAILASDNAQ